MVRTMRRRVHLIALGAALAVAAPPLAGADVAQQKHPDVLAAKVRPSGTEPKIKIYFCIKADSADSAAAHADEYRAAMKKLTA